uniref:Probable cytochrome P450 301a1, mitochondrial n=1 Tax=Cacopsylla melanoneura TaxID=428564 RepID=A0A8D8QNC6_9HEMI
MHSQLTRCKHSRNIAVKSFDQIFSPKAWPIIGHGHLFIPKIGKYSADKFGDEVYSMMKEHNVPIIKLVLNGEPMVFTVSADDTRTMFHHEGKRPERPSLKALQIIREKNEQSIGVIVSNGDTWHKLRSGVTPLLKKSLVNAYHDKHQEIAKLHVNRMIEEVNKNKEQVLRDVTTHCMKFTLHAISIISPVMNVSIDTDTEEVLRMNIDLMDALYKTMGEPPIWNLIKTKAYGKLEVANNYFYTKISNNIKTLDVTKEPFLKILFDMDHLSYKDKVITAMDIFLGGIDATATTLAMTLHYLSLDRALQDRILTELRTPDHQHRLLKACIKETLRMAATGGGNGRYVMNDTVISGYRVPKGTWLLSLNPIIGMLEEYYDNPCVYKPDRWLRETKTKASSRCPKESTQNRDGSTHSELQRGSTHPFASLPFGFGPRMCPGKLVAEQEMVLYLTEVLKTAILEPIDKEPLGMIFRTNRVPDRVINIKCLPR